MVKYNGVEINKKNNDSQKQESALVENPYSPNELKPGNWFYHNSIIEKIKKAFESHPGNKFIILQGNPGSGITRTIKRIEESPGILGKNYIPIYLDSRKYTGLDADDLSFSLYRDIVAILNRHGYEIPEPGYIREHRQEGSTLESILLTVDANLNHPEVLVLIFDEFDHLLGKNGMQIISQYIRYFKNIEKDWSNYALILAGERGLINLNDSNTIRQFLGSAFNIDMQKFLGEKTIKKLITQPVKGRLTYDDDALKRITWYSGKTLYFQQLICHYIVNFLVDKGQDHCSIEDVEESIRRLLGDDRRDFAYAWKNKLSNETRLIASALADESVTEKQEDFYFLRENSLLDDILGEKIYKEIETLQGFGYIDDMQERRFARYPFKLPLYGKWIQREHPFIKTIIDHIETIPGKIELDKLMNAIEITPKNKLPPFDKKTILNIAHKWWSLKNNIFKEGRVNDRAHIEHFFEAFSKFLKLNIKQKFPTNENYLVFNIKQLGIGILAEALCFIQDRPELTEADISNIEYRAAAMAQGTQTQTKLTLFFYFLKSAMVEDLVKKPYLNFIAIEENDLLQIIFSTRPEEIFRKIILGRLSLQRISPYHTAGPATATFYGRMDIINKISGSTDTSFAIVGARKIGKTSLLLKMVENPLPDTIYILMDLQLPFSRVDNYQVFLKDLESEMREEFNKKISFGRFPFRKSLNKFSAVIRGLSSRGKRIVFVFDEIDALLEFDKRHDYKLTRIFRSLSQNNHCQFIVAGFKELYHTKRDIENPLYNFFEEIGLKPLVREAALDLITGPMESIGIQYKNKDDRVLILEYTACHPNLLQFFCKHLIQKVDKHADVEERRTIFREDILEIFDTVYEEYVIDEVYMFFSDLSEINRLILILLVETLPRKDKFAANEIKDKLARQSISTTMTDLHRNLRNLVMRFILIDDGKDNYSFALPIFPEILRKRVDENYKTAIIKEIKGK